MRTGSSLARATDEPTRSSCLDGSLPCAGAADKSNRAVFLGIPGIRGYFPFSRQPPAAILPGADSGGDATHAGNGRHLATEPDNEFLSRTGHHREVRVPLTQLGGELRYLIDFTAYYCPWQ